MWCRQCLRGSSEGCSRRLYQQLGGARRSRQPGIQAKVETGHQARPMGRNWETNDSHALPLISLPSWPDHDQLASLSPWNLYGCHFLHTRPFPGWSKPISLPHLPTYILHTGPETGQA